MDLFVPFLFLGLFKLLFLYWSDINTFFIDERHSSFMMGVVVLLYFLSERLIEMMIVLFIFSFLLVKIKELKWLSGLAGGDISVLSWVVAGFWFFGWVYLVIFLASYLLFLGSLVIISKKNKGLPIVFPIVCGFIIVWCFKALSLI